MSNSKIARNIKSQKDFNRNSLPQKKIKDVETLKFDELVKNL